MERVEIEQGICDKTLIQINEEHMTKLEDKLDKIDDKLDKLDKNFTALDTNFKYLQDSYKEIKEYARNWSHATTERFRELELDLENIKSNLRILNDFKLSFEKRTGNIFEYVIKYSAVMGVGSILTLLIEHIKGIFT